MQTGVDAVMQGQFSDAIKILEGLCNGQLRPPARDYYQARMWLVRAYKDSGQLPQAIKLCRQLATSSHPQVQRWAKHTLSNLRAPASVSSVSAVTPSSLVNQPSRKRVSSVRAVTLQSEGRLSRSRPIHQTEADKLLLRGIQALRQQKFPEAVKALEAFMQGAMATHPNINYAQTSLAKAYMGNGQSRLALQLAHKLIKHKNAGAQAWARQFIETHSFRKLARKSGRQAVAYPDPDVETGEPRSVETSEPCSVETGEPCSTLPTEASTIQVSVSATSQRANCNPDLSTPILSATCYGAFYAGPILSFLFPFGDTITFTNPFSMAALLGSAAFAFLNWIAPIVVAVSILLFSKDRVAKANAREAINFWITAVCLGLLVGVVGGISFILSLFVFPAFALLIGVLLALVGVVFYIAPLVGLVMCLAKPFESFEFPFVWHIVGS